MPIKTSELSKAVLPAKLPIHPESVEVEDESESDCVFVNVTSMVISDKTFTLGVFIDEHLKATAVGHSKQEAQVKADRVLTLFMLNTLADNARKFTSAEGQVIVSAIEAEQYVEISVSDTGEGMTPEQLAHLFDAKPIVDDDGDAA